MTLEDLYREVIMDHYRRPRNRGTLGEANVVMEGVNPLCGDEIKLWLNIDDAGVITGASFDGHGCSISQSSASIMTEAVIGKPLVDAHAVIADFRGMMLEGEAPDELLLGDGVALEGVRKFPVRIKCAVLSWNTLKLGLDEHATAGGQRVELQHSET